MDLPNALRRLLVVVPLLTGCAASVGDAEPRRVASADPVTSPARATAPFPVPVVEVAGDATTLGTSYGQQLSAPMKELLQGYLHRWFKSDTTRFVAYTAAQGFSAKLSPEHRAELSAVADATGIAQPDVMLAQCFLDLAQMTACSSVSLPAEAFEDRVPRLARNLDFPSLNIADKHTVVLVFRPVGRHQFAAVSWPGMLGVLSGMNEHGLVLVNMEVTRPRRLPAAMPYTYLYRTVLEQCRTVDEAVALLERTPRQTPNNIMLMDATGARAVVEITPDAIVARRGDAGAGLVSTNHHRGPDQATPGRCERYDHLVARARDTFGHADVSTLSKMLQGVQQGNMTLQAMVFEPTTRVLYLSTGKRAADRELHRLDLEPYFNRGR